MTKVALVLVVRKLFIALCCIISLLSLSLTVTAAENNTKKNDRRGSAQSSVDDEEFDPESEAKGLYGFVDHHFKEEKILTGRAAAPFLSILLPGLGQTLNGEYIKAGGHLAFFGASKYMADVHQVDIDRLSYVESRDDNNVYKSKDSVRNEMYTLFHQNMRFYSAFDAYRVASIKLGKNGGETPISDESFGELAFAPFNPDHLSKSMVLAPIFLLGAYYVGRSSAQEEDPTLTRFLLDDVDKDEVLLHGVAQYEAVSIGEEVFYRGVLNTELIRALGVYPGIFVSSVIFGFSHTGQGISADSFIASVYGLYLGYTHHRYGYDLGPNIALHFWWNTLIHASVTNRSKKITIPLAYFVF